MSDDDDITIEQALANKPDPTPAPGIDWQRVRDENARRHAAAHHAARCHRNGWPRTKYERLA